MLKEIKESAATIEILPNVDISNAEVHYSNINSDVTYSIPVADELEIPYQYIVDSTEAVITQ